MRPCCTETKAPQSRTQLGQALPRGPASKRQNRIPAGSPIHIVSGATWQFFKQRMRCASMHAACNAHHIYVYERGRCSDWKLVTLCGLLTTARTSLGAATLGMFRHLRCGFSLCPRTQSRTAPTRECETQKRRSSATNQHLCPEYRLRHRLFLPSSEDGWESLCQPQEATLMLARKTSTTAVQQAPLCAAT